jgi:hypothetical protein
MLLLTSLEKLRSGSELREAIIGGLKSSLLTAVPDQSVVVQGDAPEFQLIRIDVSSLPLNFSRAPAPKQPFVRRDTCRAQRLECVAAPGLPGPARVNELDVEVEQAELELVADAGERRWLKLREISGGCFRLDLRGGELDELLWVGLGQALAQKGMSLEGGMLRLHQSNEREVQLEAEVRGRKGFLRGTVVLRCGVVLDPSLSVRLVNVNCSGRGAVGSMVAPLLQSRLAELQRRPISLLGDFTQALECRAWEMAVGEGNALRVRAELGRRPGSRV